MRRLAEKQSFINVHEKSSKEDHVSPTELWVMTNGETVTREHLLLKERVPLQKSPMGEEVRRVLFESWFFPKILN